MDLFVCLVFFFPSSLWREVYVQNPIALNCEDVDFSSLILYSLAKFGQTLSFFRLLPFPSAILFLLNPPPPRKFFIFFSLFAFLFSRRAIVQRQVTRVPALSREKPKIYVGLFGFVFWRGVGCCL